MHRWPRSGAPPPPSPPPAPTPPVRSSLLLDGWHGAAATEFAEAWADWLDAAATVGSSLEGLADALVAFQGDLTTCDSSSAAALTALAGRLS